MVEYGSLVGAVVVSSIHAGSVSLSNEWQVSGGLTEEHACVIAELNSKACHFLVLSN